MKVTQTGEGKPITVIIESEREATILSLALHSRGILREDMPGVEIPEGYIIGLQGMKCEMWCALDNVYSARDGIFGDRWLRERAVNDQWD